MDKVLREARLREAEPGLEFTTDELEAWEEQVASFFGTRQAPESGESKKKRLTAEKMAPAERASTSYLHGRIC